MLFRKSSLTLHVEHQVAAANEFDHKEKPASEMMQEKSKNNCGKTNLDAVRKQE